MLPPSRRGEESWVLLTGAFIVLCVIYIVGFERFSGPAAETDAAQSGLLSYQVLFRDLPSPEQRVFRQMQEGLVEAMAMRSAPTGNDWPDTATLAEAGIPPFAADVLDKSGLRWSRQQSGLLYQYIGIPAAPGSMPAFLLSIQEPDPQTGEKPAPNVVDEEHQLLPDGRLLHVTYWKHAADSLPAAIVPDPAMRGWTQIRVRSPLEELTQK